MSIPVLILIDLFQSNEDNLNGYVKAVGGDLHSFENGKTQCLVKDGNEYYGMALRFNGESLILEENIESNSVALDEVDKIYLIIE